MTKNVHFQRFSSWTNMSTDRAWKTVRRNVARLYMLPYWGARARRVFTRLAAPTPINVFEHETSNQAVNVWNEPQLSFIICLFQFSVNSVAVISILVNGKAVAGGTVLATQRTGKTRTLHMFRLHVNFHSGRPCGGKLALSAAMETTVQFAHQRLDKIFQLV